MRKVIAWWYLWTSIMIASYISKEATAEFLTEFVKKVRKNG